MNNEEQVKSKKVQETTTFPNPKKRLITSLLLVVAIAIGLWIGYQKVLSNPLSIYKRAINETYELMSNYFEENLNRTFQLSTLEEPFVIKTDFELNSNLADLEDFRGYTYHLEFGLDYPENIMNANFKINNGNTQIINLLLSLINDHGYLQSEEIFDQVLDLGQAEFDFDSLANLNEISMNNDDYQIVLKGIKNILIQ